MAIVTGWVAFVVTVATIACIYGLLTIGLNLQFGFTGLLNFGHVAFFAAGAYTAAIVSMPPPGTVPGARYMIGLAVPMPAGLLITLAAATLMGGVLAALIGVSAIRLESHYLAIATFALAGIFYDVLVNERWLTNGTFGMTQVPKPLRATLGADAWALAYLLFAAAMLAVVYLLVGRLLEAPFGRVLRGVRESTTAAEMLGKDTDRIKLVAFSLGGAIAGLAGGVYAHYIGSVVTGQFVAGVTFTVWAALLLGGVASHRGAVVGAFILVAFQQSTRFITSAYDAIVAAFPDTLGVVLTALAAPLPGHPAFLPSVRFMIIGLLFILVIRFRPAGVLGDPQEVTVMGSEE
ncbi:MAG: branched-chain amino acid ABC transporter permease [Haloferacaceae archaeon]|jgi:branched-chain amino acid transport system permease protein|nr:branched-chain amino acid ABC transporter permease [Haloferacaceae archaeon]